MMCPFFPFKMVWVFIWELGVLCKYFFKPIKNSGCSKSHLNEMTGFPLLMLDLLYHLMIQSVVLKC